MARPLIVEPNTERLQVVLMRDCATVDATNVTLTVTRKGETARWPVLDCVDACMPPYPRAHDVAEGRWGGCGGCGESNCGECGKRSPTLAPCHPCEGAWPVVVPSPSKTYTAESVERGVATFAIDHDLTEAPEGWYLGRVAVEGCEITVLTIWVRGSATIARSV
ncbi:MAG: hypothetical protein ACOY82_08855 [Pseudomonadota bacterium]